MAYFSVSITATGVDFLLPDAGLEVTFSSGSMGCVDFAIVDDSLIEGSEQFTVTIVEAGTAQIISPSIAMVTITDEDSENFYFVTKVWYILCVRWISGTEWCTINSRRL